MTLTQIVAKNTIIQIIGRFLSLILGVVVIGLMMRYLGPEEYGYYSISIAFLQVVGIIADFGLYLMTLQYLGELDGRPELGQEEKQNRINLIMQNIFTLRFFLAAFFYGLAFIISLFFPYPLIVKIGILILSFSLFFSTLNQILSAFYQKIFRASKIVIGEIVGRLCLLAAIILFIELNFGFYFILAAFILSSGVNFLVLWQGIKPWAVLKFKFDFSIWRKILSRTWPIGLAIIFNTIYFKVDTLILSFYHPAIEVGIYGACYRVLEILITFPPLFLGLIFAQITAAWVSQNLERLKILLQKSFDFLIIIALPLIFGTLVLGPQIMRLLGGPEFISSGQVLRVVIIACGVLFVAELFKQVVISLEKQKLIIWFYLITAILALIGYFIFIPQYSYWGAAWMTVAAETLMFIFLLLTVWRTTKFLPNLKLFWKSLAASLIMFFVLAIFSAWNLFILISLGILVYFFSLYLFKGISKKTIKEIISIKELRL